MRDEARGGPAIRSAAPCAAGHRSRCAHSEGAAEAGPRERSSTRDGASRGPQLRTTMPRPRPPRETSADDRASRAEAPPPATINTLAPAIDVSSAPLAVPGAVAPAADADTNTPADRAESVLDSADMLRASKQPASPSSSSPMAAVAGGGGDHDGSSSDGGLPTSPRQPCWLAGASAAAADGRAAAVEVMCVLAQSYLMCFGLWAGLLAFMQSMFWHILGGLSVDYFAFAVLFSLTVLCPIILEARPVLRLYGRHEWVMMGVVPAAAALLALIPSQSVRTLFTGIWAAAAFAGLAGCLAGPASSALARRAPASLVIGCVMLQAMRLGWSGATPIVDSGFVGWYIAGCILAVLSAILLFVQRCGDGTPQAGEAAEQPYVCCERGHACWIWLFVGPVLGGAVSLTIAYF
eukprot:COSAG01_NODE_7042_length_3379_cov_1.695732_3_plen_406_part_01